LPGEKEEEVIINLTQHPATPEQVTAGVVEPANKQEVKDLLTFDKLPTRSEIVSRASQLAHIAVDAHFMEPDGEPMEALIGGAPYLMAPLERELRTRGITPLYAFSRRESVETTDPNGAVVKKSVFKHVGFVRD